MELSGQKLRFFVKKRSKRGIYHLKNVKFRLRDVEVASSNLVTSTKKQKGAMLPFVFCLWVLKFPWLLLATTKFAYPTRRSTSSLVRRRVWVSRSEAELPCFALRRMLHLDQKNKSHTEIALRMAFCSFCFLRSSDLKSEIVL